MNWEAEPEYLIAIAAIAIGYTVAILLMHRRPTRRQGLAFSCAILALLVILTGPIDEYARGRFFAAYIFQQMLIAFVFPPLFLLGLPAWMVRPVLLNRFVEPFARLITRPILAFLLFAGTFTLIHYPALCDRVCHSQQFYGGIHTILLIVGVLLWWPLLSPLPEYPRLSYPVQILYLFMLMIPMTAVAAPITMAESVIYIYYDISPHPFGLTPMADQVLGGLIMWIGQGVYVMFVVTGIFFRWALHEDTEEPPFNRQTPAPVHLFHPTA
ncbi:MAG TPA: cytochrome c oxidase assembly protein [Candidatus Binataceae bacterium]|nr:cytochrome c oxidase assembly protein [Candidatus Binataceae bacterium]